MSTDSVAPGERAAIWRDWVWTHFGGLDSDLYGDTGFDGHKWMLGLEWQDNFRVDQRSIDFAEPDNNISISSPGTRTGV